MIAEGQIVLFGRLAVVNPDILLGKIGWLDDMRLAKIKEKLSKWIQST